MKAYGYNRPLSMGTYPKGFAFTEMVNFHGKQWVDEVGKSCFGYIEFTEEVPEDILRSYELITPEMYQASKPSIPPERVLEKMACLSKEENTKKLMRMMEILEKKGYDLEATDTALQQLLHTSELDITVLGS